MRCVAVAPEIVEKSYYFFFFSNSGFGCIQNQELRPNPAGPNSSCSGARSVRSHCAFVSMAFISVESVVVLKDIVSGSSIEKRRRLLLRPKVVEKNCLFFLVFFTALLRKLKTKILASIFISDKVKSTPTQSECWLISRAP